MVAAKRASQIDAIVTSLKQGERVRAILGGAIVHEVKVRLNRGRGNWKLYRLDFDANVAPAYYAIPAEAREV